MDFAGPEPKLTHIANMRVNVEPSISAGQTPAGIKQWFEISSGFITSPSPTASPQLSLKIQSGGGDYAGVHPEAGFLTLDVSMVALSDDNEFFKFSNTGYVKFDETTTGIIAGDKEAKSTQFGGSEVVETVKVNTSSVTWGWLNFATLVGQGRLVVEDGVLTAIEMRLFEVEMKVV
jgi:uncharacterized protein DUF3237